MDSIKAQRVLGLIGSSSLDGMKAAVISTDGVDVYDRGPFLNVPYDDALRERLRGLYAGGGCSPELRAELADFCASVVRDIIDSYAETIELIGFHGLIVGKDASEAYEVEIGQELAAAVNIPVVSRFRAADINAGGQGAPLPAVYHQYISGCCDKPVVVINIGGISSLTWIGSNGECLAFDTGPGNAAVNDWVFRHGGQHMDYNGRLAITGKINEPVLASMMRHKFFGKYPPKAASRNMFNEKLEHLEGLSLEDGAATATAYIAESIAYSLALYVPEMPREIIICGGGARNPSLLRFLRRRIEKAELKTAEDIGLNAEAVEAQAFAYMAARRRHHLPSTFPGTTGVAEPVICGEVFEPPLAER